MWHFILYLLLGAVAGWLAGQIMRGGGFASVDKDFQWDGRVRGKLLQNVIYTYVMTYINQENQPVQKKGKILVL